ncbi:hypothetical protein HA402_015092 [Bradysia odoriphaga]|nr:hypothetical protein HA402_015092 [Bradysia odoriphaga]
MDQDGPPAAKQMRYSLRSTPARCKPSTDSITKSEHRYMLRSETRLPLTELSLPKRKRPAKSLMILNDDCFRKVFEYLKPREIRNIANVNQRLQALADHELKRMFRMKYKIQFDENFDFIPVDDSIRISVEAIEAMLSTFGDHYHSLELSRNTFDYSFNLPYVLEVIQKYCSNVKQLTLNGFRTDSFNHRFFIKLKSLTLQNCSVSFVRCIMPQLEILKLDKVETVIPVHSFSALEEVRISNMNINNDDIKKLIMSNRTIKRLSIVKCWEASPYFFSVLPNLIHLEEFEFKKRPTPNNRELSALWRLKKLKTLKFSYKNYNVSPLLDGFINNGISIEHLELGIGNFDARAAAVIAKMQTLKVLKFHDMNGLNASHMVSVAHALKNLRTLYIKTDVPVSQNKIVETVDTAKCLKYLKVHAPNFVLDVNTYQALVAAIKRRNKYTPLKLTIYSKQKQLLVPNEILKGQNEIWLLVQELDEKNHRLFEDLSPYVRAS